MPIFKSFFTCAGRRYSRLGTVILLLTASRLSVAEVGLGEIVDGAYQRHAYEGLVEARRELGQALGERASQLLADVPTFNVKYQTDALGSGDGYREWESGVELPLWWPGQRSASRAEAARTLESAGALGEATRLEVAGEVRERLWAWALADSEQEHAQHAYAGAQELERDVERRLNAGEIPRSDLLLAQKETLLRHDMLLQAQNRAAQAKMRFLGYTGQQSLPPVQAEQPAQQPELPEQHPSLVLAAIVADVARAHRDRIASEKHAGTSVWVGGRSSRDMSGASYDSAVGLELSVPLGSRAQTAPALAEAEQALTAALIEQQGVRLRLQEQLQTARLEHQRADEALQRARRRQELADESLRMSRRAFELGEIDLVRLLAARNDALESRHDQHALRLQAGLAIARLNQILGVIPQ